MKDIIVFLLKIFVGLIGFVIFYGIVKFPEYAILIFPFLIIPLIISHLLKDIFLEILILFAVIVIGIFISLLIYNTDPNYNPIVDKIIILLEIVWIIFGFYILQKIDEKISHRQSFYIEKKENLLRRISSLNLTAEKITQEINNNSIQICNFNLIKKIAGKLSTIVSLDELKIFVEKSFPEFFLGKAEVKLILENTYNEFEKNIIREIKPNNKYVYIYNIQEYKSININTYPPQVKSVICLPLEESMSQDKNINYLFITSNEYLSENFLRFAIILGKYVALNISNTRLIQKTKELAITDSLTGLYVQKYFKEVLEQELSRAKSYNKKLSIVMIDIDNFKNINDTYGHNAGDEVLIKFAEILRKRLRESDIISRYGGDEFAIILFDADQQNAFKVVEEIRKNVLNEVVINRDFIRSDSSKIRFSISCGILEYDKNFSVEDFIDLVDKRLYKAKMLGKNRTVL